MTGLARPPSAFVHGVDGPVVIVPGRVAAWLGREFRLDRRRIEVRGADAELDSVLVALGVAAAAWRSSALGTDHRNRSEPRSSLTVMTTADVADRLDCTNRAVVKAIADGRLPARKEGRRWLVDPEDFAHYYEAATAAS